MEPGSLDMLLAQWVRLEAELTERRRQPASDENAARREDIALRQKEIELAVYRTPAQNLRDMMLKLQFMVRNRDARLPEDLRIEDAYALPFVEGNGLLGIAIAGLWADVERLSAPDAD